MRWLRGRISMWGSLMEWMRRGRGAWKVILGGYLWGRLERYTNAFTITAHSQNTVDAAMPEDILDVVAIRMPTAPYRLTALPASSVRSSCARLTCASMDHDRHNRRTPDWTKAGCGR